MSQAQLIIFSGLPGVGKTTVATRIATLLGATYLRIDAIEQAMLRAGAEHVGPAGYAAADAIAEANLGPGRMVVIDGVNAAAEARQGWHALAQRSSSRLVNLHLVCSDIAEHRRRVEGREADLANHRLPSWTEVESQQCPDHEGEHLRLDTAGGTPETAAEQCLAYIASVDHRGHGISPLSR
jgi:predicted kinase